MDKAAQKSIKNTPLDQLEVLAVDCKATAANPDKGHLLEIGFMPGSAIEPVDIKRTRFHLIRPGGFGGPL